MRCCEGLLLRRLLGLLLCMLMRSVVCDWWVLLLGLLGLLGLLRLLRLLLCMPMRSVVCD